MFPRGIAADPHSGRLFVADQANNRIDEFTAWGQFVQAFGGGVVPGGAQGTGTLSAGSATVTGLKVTNKAFVAGQTVTGPGIPPHTTILATTTGAASTMTLSKAATENVSGATLSVAVGPGNIPLNEVQTVALGAGVTGGSFKLNSSASQGYAALTSASIPFNASAAQVEAALAGLESIGTGNVSVTSANPGGGSSPGGPYRIEFTGALADTNISPLTVSSELVGGVATVATTVDGAGAFEVCGASEDCQAAVRGSARGQFSAPVGVALDSAGDLYVVDLSNSRVEKFDPTAGPGEDEVRFLLTFGGKVNETKVEAVAPEEQQNLCPIDPGDVCGAGVQGTGKGQFSSSWAAGSFVAIDEKGTEPATDDRVYVGDKNRIQVFDTGGHYLEDLPDPEGLLAGKTVNSLAVDPAGNLYAASLGVENVLKLNPAGHKQCTLSVARPSAIAADAGGRVWVVSAEKFETPPIRMRIAQFETASSCAETTSFDANSEGFTASTGIATNRCAGSDAPGDLYVVNASVSKAFLRAYGTPPKGCEPPPPVPPSITAQFPFSVNTDGAQVRAKINPHFFDDVTYYVEYGTGSCSSGGCDKRAPLGSEAQLGGGVTQAELTTSSVFLAGLSPDTTYHYRFVAKSGGGGPVYGIDPDGEGEESQASFEEGLEATFTTPPLSPLPSGEGCSNEELRTGSSARLPDCRAFEMVSPVDKNGFGIEAALASGSNLVHAALDQSSGSGERLTYSSKQAFGDAVGSPFSSQYLAGRDPSSGWITHSINPPRKDFPLFRRQSLDTEYRAFSKDLRFGWLIHDGEPPLAPCAPPDSPDLYRRDNADDSYQALHCEPNQAAENSAKTIELQGVSKDGCRSVFRSNGRLTQDSSSALNGDGKPIFQLYESSCEGGLPVKSGEGGLRLVGVMPNGIACAKESSAGFLFGISGDGRSRNVRGAFSSDAHRLYWVCANTLFLRSDPNPAVAGEEGEGSVKVAGAVEEEPPEFQAASPDGARMLFIGGDSVSKTSALWTYDAVKGTTTRLATGVPQGSLAGASEDATAAYFASSEVLTETPNSIGDKAIDGKPNLYLYREGAPFAFVGTLSEGDLAGVGVTADYSPIHEFPFRRASRVTPDGAHAAFISSAAMTGYDNTDAESGEADAEVFVYDAGANEGKGKISCVSCNPTGARPHGRVITAAESTAFGGIWGAAWIPGWQTELYPGRPFSDNGKRLFFNSFDALVNRDTNGRTDVYEWEQASSKAQCEEKGAELYVASANGCLSLISTGQDDQDSEFVDADTEGKNVFIRTNESLLPQDPGLVDIYDARIDGGFPQPPATQSECEGEACQSPPASPVPATPSSSVFTGPGNEQPAKTKKHKKKKHHKKHKAHKQSKRHKGKANANRRAGR